MSNNLKFYMKFQEKCTRVEKFNEDEYYIYLPKNGKDYKLKFHKYQEEELLTSGLLDYKLIEGYEAIYSTTKKIIECQLTGINSTDYENLCCFVSNYYPTYSNERNLIELPPDITILDNTFGIKLSIGYCSKSFQALLKCKHPIKSINNDIFCLTITEIEINSHQEAIEKLTKFGLSALFSISSELQLTINLLNDQPRSNYHWSEVYNDELALQSDAELPVIEQTYIIQPLKYYLNANVCNELPFYQFLQYYHCLEYFYPEYKNLRDNSNKNLKSKSCKLRIIQNCLDRIRRKKKSNSELENLKYLLNQCLVEKSIYDFIKKYSKLKNYYFDTTDYKQLSILKIKHCNSISLNKIAKRIYKIRNAIVHSKSDENKIEPNEKNFNLVKNDIKLVKYLVEEILRKKKKIYGT